MRLKCLSLINFNYYLGWVPEGNSFDLKAFAEIVRTSRLSCNEIALFVSLLVCLLVGKHATPVQNFSSCVPLCRSDLSCASPHHGFLISG